MPFLRRLGRRGRAVASSEEADRSARAHLMHGDALMRVECFDEADVVLAAGAILWPGNAEFYSHRGLCAEMSGDPNLAADRWRDLVRFFPHIAMGYHRLAAALRVTGEVEEAVTTIEIALADHSNDPAVIVESARIYEAAQRPSDALAQWDRVIAEHGECQDWLDERERLRRTPAPAAAVEA